MGEADVDVILALGIDKLRRWMAYDLIDPFGQDREDLRAGIIASTSLNPHRKKGSPAFKARDFMPKFGERFFTDNEYAGLSVEQQVNLAFGILAGSM